MSKVWLGGKDETQDQVHGMGCWSFFIRSFLFGQHLLFAINDKIKEVHYMLRNSSHLIARSVGGDLMLSGLLMSLMAKTYPITKPCSDTCRQQKNYRGTQSDTVLFGEQLTESVNRGQSCLDSELSCHLHIALVNLNI